MEVVASLSQCRTAAAQCGLFTHKSVPVIFEPPCITALCAATTSVVGKISYLHTIHETLNNLIYIFLVFEKISKENVFRHRPGFVTT